MKISVCMASYNGSSYIVEQVQSILAQLSMNDELIISDDNSSDDTLELIESINDNRIIVLTNNNKGHVTNFENAIKSSTGDYIFLSDQDDIWLYNKVSLCVEFLKVYDCVITNYLVVDKNLNPLKLPKYTSQLANNRFLFIKSLMFNRGWLGCCLCFNAKIKDIVLPFPSNIVAHDVWIVNCSTLFGNVFYLNEKLILQRRHGNNVSFNGINDMVITNRSNSSILTIFNHRLILIVNLLKLIVKKALQ